MVEVPVKEMEGMTVGAGSGKGTAKRDALRRKEEEVQAMWDAAKVFESNADYEKKEKFMVTFPYPYSNGHLHIGHAFSLTKAVFRAQFERHNGKHVLFPFAFHCTGMPIQAAANKLKTEIQLYGTPPQFPEDSSEEVKQQMLAEKEKEAAAKAAIAGKGKGQKTKLVSKTGTGIVRQWNILKKMVPEEDIPAFVDPIHWLMHFPPIGVKHLLKFGAGIDWRRAFITTAVNPYYDAFIRWQFYTLQKKNKINFGKRNNVYSIVDQQVCADHDRSEGEGVGPQEYVLIHLQVVNDNKLLDATRHAKMIALMEQEEAGVYLVPATLRPETMYGQTNCFVLPSGDYGAYYVDSLNKIFIMSERSSRGLSCQLNASGEYFTKEFANITCLATFKGDDLLGLPLKAPLCPHDVVYTLPLLTISMGKGTGVVTSVPSDAPDDYMALKTLKEKPDYCAKFGLDHARMVDPYDVIPIIQIDGYGPACAEDVCNKLKIKSSNDTAKLLQAKEETYLKGFTSGVMTVGEYVGKKVADVKPIIKQQLIDQGLANLYFEPEKKVVSRTQDECVVAATDQWYLVYGEDSWKEAVKKHVFSSDFSAYDETALGKYDHSIGWLKEWACTRQFGLGTQLPWDTQWVIESLSDSTIYMAYYTIAHILQGQDNLNGHVDKTPHQIAAEDLTNEVFDYIYLKNAPFPSDTKIPKDVLDNCQKEFRYWYPLDLRVSAKDLIPNHLTMALYNHAAIWDDEPELWPRSYYTNGHVLVDAEKMSKSKGNFLMMDETIDKFSADATRLACADAGDSLDDANFSRETADSTIVSLINEETWITESLKDTNLRTSSSEYNFMDRVLVNETNRLMDATHQSYSNMQFREGIQHGWFEMLLARNEYRAWCQDSNTPMHKDVLIKWSHALIIAICRICPH